MTQKRAAPPAGQSDTSARTRLAEAGLAAARKSGFLRRAGKGLTAGMNAFFSSHVQVPLLASLNLLTALETISMTMSALRGEGWIFKTQIQQARLLEKQASALIQAYGSARFHEEILDMWSSAVEIDLTTETGEGSDAFSDFAIETSSTVARQVVACEELLDQITKSKAEVDLRIKWSEQLLENVPFLVASAIAAASEPTVQVYVALMDLEKISGMLARAKAGLPEHLSLLKDDLGLLEANIIQRGWLV
jgi:hypothetical protein